ncbi:SHOCT domain-containing protein [Desulfosporosinus sp. BICA1-9]|uniref:SHOCT domain-containing protein n=1 Tax=Desulfosporosinus sp. BICA1-9 TaxID=1531958 RepID=UPI00054B7787|nr:membrane protein [Desulfosporosinus sp. BICA1-9]KJS48602.1 MAG: membrane protein [Peptococcaceae bacterium BRH_c23]KJS90590.1 MAG: membrane protein [Desulfosporosinus sp. BICA1-9]
MLGGWGSFYAGGFWGMGILGMAIQLLFWIVLIALIINIFRRIASRILIRRIIEQDKALDVLLGRYACGEIDLKEYQKRKKELLL